MNAKRRGNRRKGGKRAGAARLGPQDRHQPDAGPPRKFTRRPLQRQPVRPDRVGGVLHAAHIAPYPGQNQEVSDTARAPPPGQASEYGSPEMATRDDRTFGERLRALRERSDMSQRKLGEKSGVGKSSVDRIEKSGQAPTIDKVQALADALGVDIRELTNGTLEPIDVESVLRQFEAEEAAAPIVRPTEDELKWLRSLRLTWREIPPSVEMMRLFVEGKRRAGI